MNTLHYYTRRLLPFFLVYFTYEVMEFGILTMRNPIEEGFGSIELLVLLNETLISFWFSILPYLLYLLVLPAAFHSGRKDRLMTSFLFVVFCVVNAVEEMAEVVSGDQFHLLTAELLHHPQKVWESWGVVMMPGGMLALCLAGGSVLLFRRRLVAEVSAPSAAVRLGVPLLGSIVAFILLQAQTGLVISSRNPELYSDGLFSLFGGIVALDAVPNLKQIFAQPCVWIAVMVLTFWVLNAAISCYIGKNKAPLFCLQKGWQKLCNRYGRFQVCLVCLLSSVLLVRLFSLGIYPLMDTTEARYGEMARKMIETGYWLQPQFDYGVPFWGKPPLSFQASALTMQIFGMNAFAVRLAPFLASLALGGLFFCWPFETQKKSQGAAAFLVFLSSAIGFVSSGAVMTDIFLALGVMLSMVAFWRGISEGGAPRYWGYLFFIGLAVGLLSKGPLVLVLCGFPIFLWTLFFHRWRELWQRLPWGWGILMMLVLTVPWYMMAEHATPGFLRYFLWGEHVERFLVKGWQGDLYGSGHSRALGMIWLYAFEMFLPWALLVPFLWNRRALPWNERESRGYLWLWGVCPLLFFTPARNILPAYVLPSIPAFCLLLVQTLWKRAETQPAIRHFIFIPVPILLLMMLFVLGGGFSHIKYRCDRDMLRAWNPTFPLYYACARVPFSGQFYSSGKARSIEASQTEDIPSGSFLAVPEGDPLANRLSEKTDWQQVFSGYRWQLWQRL